MESSLHSESLCMAMAVFVGYIIPGYFYNDIIWHGDGPKDGLSGTCRTVKLDDASYLSGRLSVCVAFYLENMDRRLAWFYM